MEYMEFIQTTFYTLGSIFMLSLIIATCVFIYIMFALKNLIEQAIEEAKVQVEDLKANTIDRVKALVMDNRAKIFGTVGVAVSSFVMAQLKNAFFKKSRS